MTVKQLQKLLDGLGLSQVAAAKRIDISARQMRRYCSGEAKIPVVVECALMWVRAGAKEDGPTCKACGKPWPDYMTAKGAHGCSTAQRSGVEK